MKILSVALAALLALSAAGAANAQPGDVDAQLAANAENLGLKGVRGPSLFQPGFGVGEYSGFSKTTTRNINAADIFRQDKVSMNFTVNVPAASAPVTAQCHGGQSTLSFVVTWKREGLDLVCTFGGGAPEGARFDLALAQGPSIVGRILQPQRAAQITFGGVTLKAETRVIAGAFLLGGGKPISYLISRMDGTPVGGVTLSSGFGSTFYLPKEKGAERDAAAVMALALFLFPDPGRGGRF